LIIYYEFCCRHNTQLIKGIPEMLSSKISASDKIVSEYDAKEAQQQAWFQSTIAEMEDNTARRVNFAEATAEKARKQGTDQAQELRRQLTAAIEQCKTIVRPAFRIAMQKVVPKFLCYACCGFSAVM
jgi:hypothetical protein